VPAQQKEFQRHWPSHQQATIYKRIGAKRLGTLVLRPERICKSNMLVLQGLTSSLTTCSSSQQPTATTPTQRRRTPATCRTYRKPQAASMPACSSSMMREATLPRWVGILPAPQLAAVWRTAVVYRRACLIQQKEQWTANGLVPLKLIWTGLPASYGASTVKGSSAYSGADSFACIQLLSVHKQCHQLHGLGLFICFTCLHTPFSTVTNFTAVAALCGTQ
jgi:hypothetical protein